MTLFTEPVEKNLPKTKIDVFNTDWLFMSSIPYYLFTYTITIAFVLIWNHAWALMFLIYVNLPLFDEIFTQDTRNPTEQ